MSSMRERTFSRTQRKMKLFKKIGVLILILAAFSAGAVSYRAYDMYQDALEGMPLSSKVEEIRAIENYTTYDELPETYINAVIAVEDKRFDKHNGVDIISTCRAILLNLKAGELQQGGSTITQQLARNMYFEQDKDICRKLAEIFVALNIEKKYSKEEILELYVNTIYFGSGYYNIYDAAMGYFEKSQSELNDYECTMLAGIPQAPSVYSLDANPDLAEQRRQQVIDCMTAEGYIEEGEIN